MVRRKLWGTCIPWIDSRFLAEDRMNDQVGRVALDGLSSCGRADDMRKICTLGMRSLARAVKRRYPRVYQSQCGYCCEEWCTSVTAIQSTSAIADNSNDAHSKAPPSTPTLPRWYRGHVRLLQKGEQLLPDCPLCKEPFRGGMICLICSITVRGTGMMVAVNNN